MVVGFVTVVVVLIFVVVTTLGTDTTTSGFTTDGIIDWTCPACRRPGVKIGICFNNIWLNCAWVSPVAPNCKAGDIGERSCVPGVIWASDISCSDEDPWLAVVVSTGDGLDTVDKMEPNVVRGIVCASKAFSGICPVIKWGAKTDLMLAIGVTVWVGCDTCVNPVIGTDCVVLIDDTLPVVIEIGFVWIVGIKLVATGWDWCMLVVGLVETSTGCCVTGIPLVMDCIWNAGIGRPALAILLMAASCALGLAYWAFSGVNVKVGLTFVTGLTMLVVTFVTGLMMLDVTFVAKIKGKQNETHCTTKYFHLYII